MVVPNAAVHGRGGVQGPARPDRVVLQHRQQSENHQGGRHIGHRASAARLVLPFEHLSAAFPSHLRRMCIRVRVLITVLQLLSPRRLRHLFFLLMFRTAV